MGFKYHTFHTLTAQKNPLVQAQVVLQYTKTKNNKTYFVLKLKSDFGTFYTTTYEDLKPIKYRYITMRVITDKLSFWTFCKDFTHQVLILSCFRKEM